MTKHNRYTVLLTALLLFALSPRTSAKPPALTLIVHTIAPACNASSGVIILTATGGVPPYTFTFKGINAGAQGTFPGLQPGVYPVTVTDATGATASQTVTLTQTIDPPQVTVSAYTDPTGCGMADGTVTLTATGGAPPYQFSSDDSIWQSSNVFTNLAIAGPYNYYPFFVRDANGCLAWPLNTPTLTNDCPVEIHGFDYNSLLYGCGTSKSYIHITLVVGGTPPYTYSLDGINYQSGSDFDNLPAGDYKVYVRDAAGLIAIQSFVITEECALAATYTETDAGCAHNDGTITVTASHANPPYTYSVDGLNYQSANVFTGLTAGTYRVIIRDLYGNMLPILATVFDDCPIVTAVTANESCGNGKGSITADGSNGTAPYQYSLDGVNYQVSPFFPNLTAGNYTLCIRDFRGLLNSTAVTVGNACLQVSATTTAATCEKANGSLTATGAEGAAPYQYAIGAAPFQSAPLFTHLAAGNYTVTVKDATGATAATTVTITDIAGPRPAVSISPSSCDASDGSILLNAVGGTSPFLYSIDGSGFSSSNLFAGIGAGTTLTATIQDANGCTASQSITMTSKPPPQLAAIATAATCLNNDGGIVASNIGGTGPFQYSLDGVAYQSAGAFTTLPAGPQLLYIKDGNGCTASQTISIPLNDNLTVDAGAALTICQGSSADLTAQSNGLSFSWSPATGLSSPVILDPVASPQTTTQYSLTASTAVCTGTSVVTVTVNPAPVANAGQDDTTCSGKSVQLLGSGGQCSWSPVTGLDDPHSSTPTVENPTQSITYRLTVTAANGCTSLQPAQVWVTVTPPAEVSAGNDTSILVNQPVQLNAYDVNNSGFNSYTWSPPAGLTNAFIQDPVAYPAESTVYTVVASTADGCTGTASVSIKVYDVSDIFVPTGFTPNGDGHNDVLRAIPIGIREFKYFAVYNRWGQLVFRTSDAATGWDGTVNGQVQSAGAFVWVTAGFDYKGTLIQRKGTVILIR